jgi:hypothetical protein
LQARAADRASWDVGTTEARLNLEALAQGEKPGELPVQQVTKVELFLNLKTANSKMSRFLQRQEIDSFSHGWPACSNPVRIKVATAAN